MKQIQYTGSSKLISRIVHILNRKAPLPLDGQGDAVWGTNGQVLTTDGTGSTSWQTPSGGGDSVSWSQLQSTGTKIAEIEINGTSQDVYAPNGGGGHTIWNRIKTALTARSNLWFADAKISDASADDATKVEVLTELADETAFDNLPTDGTADGMYAFPDSGDEYLDAGMVGYGSGTVADALGGAAKYATVYHIDQNQDTLTVDAYSSSIYILAFLIVNGYTSTANPYVGVLVIRPSLNDCNIAQIRASSNSWFNPTSVSYNGSTKKLTITFSGTTSRFITLYYS